METVVTDDCRRSAAGTVTAAHCSLSDQQSAASAKHSWRYLESMAGAGSVPPPVARHGNRAAYHHAGVGHFLLLHRIPQRSGVLYRQPHAAMRHCTTKIALLISPVDSVSRLSEEDRIGHRRVVVLVAIVVDLHAEWLERAARRVIAAPPGRHRPVVKALAVDRDGHALGGLVDFNQQFGVSGLAKRQRRDGGGSQRRDEMTYAHL